VGKQAATNVQAGAEGTGTIGAVEALPHAPKLELVNSPKREKILEGMLEAVGAEGYDPTSVRTVLDRTGLYRQAFYDNFADKDACYLAALEMGIGRFEALVKRAAASEESWRGQLRAGLGALLDQLDAEPDFGRGVIVEVHAAGPEALARRAEAMKRAADFIDLARQDAGESESPPQIAPEGIVAGIHAIVHSRLSTGATDGFRGLLPEFMYFAVLPYFGAEAASAEMQAARA
jgi:AcrR family transcriptional regulator